MSSRCSCQLQGQSYSHVTHLHLASRLWVFHIALSFPSRESACRHEQQQLLTSDARPVTYSSHVHPSVRAADDAQGSKLQGGAEGCPHARLMLMHLSDVFKMNKQMLCKEEQWLTSAVSSFFSWARSNAVCSASCRSSWVSCDATKGVLKVHLFSKQTQRSRHVMSTQRLARARDRYQCVDGMHEVINMPGPAHSIPGGRGSDHQLWL